MPCSRPADETGKKKKNTTEILDAPALFQACNRNGCLPEMFFTLPGHISF